MIVDGRSIAAEILRNTKERVARLGVSPVVRAITCTPSPATLSYLNIKSARAADAGMKLEVVTMNEDVAEEALIEAVTMPGASAVIVQLPLPTRYNTARVVNTIPLQQDADVLSVRAHEKSREGGIRPPVVEAVAEILTRTGTTISGRNIVVVGQGKLVGLPVAEFLEREGATVHIQTLDSVDMGPLATADIVVSGAGSPHLITPDMVREGVVLIDAGTSESGGALVGDVHPACKDKARVFTPVPGGVGPIAVAFLFRNVVELLERSLQESQKTVH